MSITFNRKSVEKEESIEYEGAQYTFKEKYEGGTATCYIYVSGNKHLKIKNLKGGKELRGKYVAQMTSEKRIIDKLLILGNSFIPPVHHIIESEGMGLMGYIEGTTLCNFIAGIKSKETEEKLTDILPLLDGLALQLIILHAHGHTHRDIKPENIIFSETGKWYGNAVLIDYGQAFDAENNSSGKFHGNKFLMLPELVTGIDQDKAIEWYSKSDVMFIIGVLYYTLTTTPPLVCKSGNQFPHQRKPALCDSKKVLVALNSIFTKGFGGEIKTAHQLRTELDLLTAILAALESEAIQPDVKNLPDNWKATQNKLVGCGIKRIKAKKMMEVSRKKGNKKENGIWIQWRDKNWVIHQ